MRYRVSFSFALLAALAVSSSPVWAEHFKWIKGKDEPVCQAYKKYLEYAAAKPHWERELMCARKIPTQFPEFSQPQWDEFDPRTPEHMKLAVDILDNMTYSAVALEQRSEMTFASAAKHFKATADEITINYGRDAWYTATADIDNDGKQEKLLKYGRGPCVDWEPESLRYTVVLIVVDPGGESSLQEKTEQILQRTKSDTYQSSAESYDLFQYRGKTYVDRWENEGSRDGKRTDEQSLSVYLNQDSSSTLLCRFAKRAR